jgi:hypothetical protein
VAVHLIVLEDNCVDIIIVFWSQQSMNSFQ